MITEAWNKYRSGEYDDHDEATGEAEESQDARCKSSAKQTTVSHQPSTMSKHEKKNQGKPSGFTQGPDARLV